MVFHYDDQNEDSEDYLTIEYNDDGAVDFIFNDDESEQSPFCQLRDPMWLVGWLQKIGRAHV